MQYLRSPPPPLVFVFTFWQFVEFVVAVIYHVTSGWPHTTSSGARPRKDRKSPPRRCATCWHFGTLLNSQPKCHVLAHGPSAAPWDFSAKTCPIRFISPSRNIASSATGFYSFITAQGDVLDLRAVWAQKPLLLPPGRSELNGGYQAVASFAPDVTLIGNEDIQKSDRNKGKGEDKKRLAAPQQTASYLFSVLTPLTCTVAFYVSWSGPFCL